MMALALPPWVWDLIIAVRKFEDEHPSVESIQTCLNEALGKVPEDYIRAAELIETYNREKE